MTDQLRTLAEVIAKGLEGLREWADEMPRAMNRFSSRMLTESNWHRDVRKLKNVPVCGDTLAPHLKWFREAREHEAE